MFSPEETAIIGKNGNLGSAFIEIYPELQRNALSHSDLLPNIGNTLSQFIDENSIRIIINCAAHTNAEKGQIDKDISYKSNSVYPSILARVCNEKGVKLVHFSSTGVYGKYKEEPYSEYDDASPTTIHHHSKLMGEREVLNCCPDTLVIRTGWLFGGSPDKTKSFVWDRLMECKNNTSIASDISQYGNPTWVQDVVHQTIVAIENKCCGIFNCVSQPTVRRYDYVKEIVKLSAFNTEVSEVDGSHFERTAPVSWNEMAVNYKLELMGLNRMPDWRTSLKKYMSELEKF